MYHVAMQIGNFFLDYNVVQKATLIPLLRQDNTCTCISCDKFYADYGFFFKNIKTCNNCFPNHLLCMRPTL